MDSLSLAETLFTTLRTSTAVQHVRMLYITTRHMCVAKIDGNTYKADYIKDIMLQSDLRLK